jgi:hypothetical protein
VCRKADSPELARKVERQRFTCRAVALRAGGTIRELLTPACNTVALRAGRSPSFLRAQFERTAFFALTSSFYLLTSRRSRITVNYEPPGSFDYRLVALTHTLLTPATSCMNRTLPFTK